MCVLPAGPLPTVLETAAVPPPPPPRWRAEARGDGRKQLRLGLLQERHGLAILRLVLLDVLVGDVHLALEPVELGIVEDRPPVAAVASRPAVCRPSSRAAIPCRRSAPARPGGDSWVRLRRRRARAAGRRPPARRGRPGRPGSRAARSSEQPPPRRRRTSDRGQRRLEPGLQAVEIHVQHRASCRASAPGSRSARRRWRCPSGCAQLAHRCRS